MSHPFEKTQAIVSEIERKVGRPLLEEVGSTRKFRVTSNNIKSCFAFWSDFSRPVSQEKDTMESGRRSALQSPKDPQSFLAHVCRQSTESDERGKKKTTENLIIAGWHGFLMIALTSPNKEVVCRIPHSQRLDLRLQHLPSVLPTPLMSSMGD